MTAGRGVRPAWRAAIAGAVLVAVSAGCGPEDRREPRAAAGSAGNPAAEDGPAAPVLIYAAASLAPVLQDRFGDDPAVKISAASSAVLARQIDEGAPADLFLSADPRWITWLEERDRLEPGTRFPLVRNRLVVIGAAGTDFLFNPRVPEAFPGSFPGRLAIGDPDHVPAGAYARAALEHAGIWEALAGRVLGAVDARAACALVERGECAAGVVYASDANALEVTGRARVAGEIPETWHDPILYVGGVVAGRARPATRRIVAALQSEPTPDLFRAHGFLPAEGTSWAP